jgi:hypothetical protein
MNSKTNQVSNNGLLRAAFANIESVWEEAAKDKPWT